VVEEDIPLSQGNSTQPSAGQYCGRLQTLRQLPPNIFKPSYWSGMVELDSRYGAEYPIPSCGSDTSNGNRRVEKITAVWPNKGIEIC
jgi:hypothetical protein